MNKLSIQHHVSLYKYIRPWLPTSFLFLSSTHTSYPDSFSCYDFLLRILDFESYTQSAVHILVPVTFGYVLIALQPKARLVFLLLPQFLPIPLVVSMTFDSGTSNVKETGFVLNQSSHTQTPLLNKAE